MTVSATAALLSVGFELGIQEGIDVRMHVVVVELWARVTLQALQNADLG